MVGSAFGIERAYRLQPSLDEAADDAVAQLTVAGPRVRQTVLLPYAGGLGYFIVPAAGASVTIDAGRDFRVETLDLPLSIWLQLRLRLLFKKKKYLKFEEFSLFSYGRKPQRKRFTTFNQRMLDIGAALDGELLTGHPELLTGWPAIEPIRAAPAKGSRNTTAVVAHIYYEDTWTDIAEALKRVTVPVDLIVTTNPGREPFIERVRAEFPDADIEEIENRGRDLRPFLSLLERGRLDRYRYVCKIHSKKSITAGRNPELGALWRRRLLFDLLAAPGVVEAIIERFARDPSIGMVGPRAFRMPSAAYPEELAWVGNRPITLAIAEKMGVPPERFRLDFFAGTMFWVRPEALAPLRRLELAEACLDEQGAIDGVIEHAIERVFPTAVLAAGYRVEDCDACADVLGHGASAPLAKKL